MAKFKDFLSLIFLFILIGVVAAIGYVAYSIANDVADKTKEKMEKKNIKVSRDGLKVGMRQLSSEQVSDSTQGTLMKIWNNSSWPAYKSKLGWGQAPAGSSTGSSAGTSGTEKRKGTSRTSSSRAS